MAGPIYRYLGQDHEKLNAALQRILRDPTQLDRSAYNEFRKGLLRHISMEEKILFPAARAAKGGKPLPSTAKLHLDHAALAALLVPTPTPAIIAAICTVLDQHNPLEEGPDGVYEQCEELFQSEVDDILLRL